MSDIAIKVENFSKQFKICTQRHDTLKDAIFNMMLLSIKKKIRGNPWFPYV